MKVKIVLLFIAVSLSVGAQNTIGVSVLSNHKFNAIGINYKNIKREHYYYSVGILSNIKGIGLQFKIGAQGNKQIYPFIETSLTPFYYKKSFYTIPIHAIGIGYKKNKYYFQLSMNKNLYFGYGAEAGITF